MTLLPLGSTKHACLVYTVKAMSRVMMLSPFLMLNNLSIFHEVRNDLYAHNSTKLGALHCLELMASPLACGKGSATQTQPCGRGDMFLTSAMPGCIGI